MIYHVAPEGHQGNLLSLKRQHGDECYDIYAERWPDAGELGQYHCHYIHCYDTEDAAREHAEAFGGIVLCIDTDGLDVERDRLEFDHPIVRDEIPAQNIRAI